MDRRQFIRSCAAGAGVAAMAGCTAKTTIPAAVATKTADFSGAVFIPGYNVTRAVFRGRPVTESRRMMRNVPKDHVGPLTLISRLGPDGDLRQAVFPIDGHDIAIAPDGRTGYFAGINHDSYATFDAKTLDMISVGRSVAPGWIGGGHSAFLPGGDLIAVTERAPWASYSGTPANHFGAITVRERNTLKVVGRVSTHGMSPHEIRLLEDGEHAVVANYGNSYAPGSDTHRVPPFIVEPSVTIVNLKDGRLVEKLRSGSTKRELRHVAVRDRETIFAIQAELSEQAEGTSFRTSAQTLTEADQFAHQGYGYRAAPPVRRVPGRDRLAAVHGASHTDMRHGLSIEFDPQNNEILASFSATHRVGVFDASTGRTKRMIETDRLGLDQPAGVTMLGDSPFYAVAGQWKNLFVFTRGSHELVRDMCHYATFFGHSHIVSG